MFAINKTSFILALFLSLFLSFTCQAAEEAAAKPEAAAAQTAAPAAKQAKKGKQAKQATVQDITCPTGQCRSSVWMGGSCFDWCAGCPGSTGC